MILFQSATLTAMATGSVALAQLIRMDLAIPWYVNTSPYNLTYLGQEYLGVGRVGQIQAIDDSPGEMRSLKFSIPAITDEDVAAALAEPVQGKSVTIRTVIYDNSNPTAGLQILEAIVDWAGRLDVLRMVESDKYDTVEVTAEHIGIDLLRPCGILFTNEDHQSLFPGDNSFEYVTDQSSQTIVFPAASYFKR